MRIIFRVCERIQVLDYGKTIAVGTPEEIRTDRRWWPPTSAQKGAKLAAVSLTSRSTTAASRPCNELSLEVNEGELVGLVGHNGAGKSTTLWTITGVLKPLVAATITFEGSRSPASRPDAILRRGIALVPEGRRIFGRLTVGENLQDRHDRPARTDARREADVKRMLERFPVLGRYCDRPGAKLSGGEQQQLAIARALLARPRLLLLDEPTLGLAPLIVDQVFEILAGAARGRGDDPARRAERGADDRGRRPHLRDARAAAGSQFHGTAEELAPDGRLRDRLHRHRGDGLMNRIAALRIVSAGSSPPCSWSCWCCPSIVGAVEGIQYTLDSIAYGSLFALMALWLALLFGVMGLMNFAYGELIMAGAYDDVLHAELGLARDDPDDGPDRHDPLAADGAGRVPAAAARLAGDAAGHARSPSATAPGARLDRRLRARAPFDSTIGTGPQKGVEPYPWLTNQFDVGGVLISRLEIVTGSSRSSCSSG